MRAEPSAYREIVWLAKELHPFPLTWHAYGTVLTSIEMSTEVGWTLDLFSKGAGLWTFERKYCFIWWIIMSIFVPGSMWAENLVQCAKGVKFRQIAQV